MSLIFSSSSSETDLLGVICDRCKAEVRDSAALAEVLHVRLHGGFGSQWGDGNLVEVDLCDGCAHQTLSAYARVTPSAERLTGKRGLSVEAFHRISPSASAQKLFTEQTKPAQALPSGPGAKAVAWLTYSVRKYVIPVTLMWRPLKRWIEALFDRMEKEDRRLRSRYGLDA